MLSRLLLFALLLCSPSLTWAVIAMDGSPVNSGGSGEFGDDSFSVTVAADANFLLFCGSMSTSSSVETINTVTYAGAALTKITGGEVQGSANARTEMWYKLAPAIGTNTLAVDLTDNPWFENTVIVLKGVDQVAPTNAQALGSTTQTPTLTVSATSGYWVIDCVTVANDVSGATAGGGQTIRINQPTLDQITQLMSSIEVAAGPNVTPDWNLGTSFSGVSHVAVPLAPAVVTAPVGGRRFVIFP